MQLDSDSFWHLGGFCFGHSREDPEVALLKGRVEWDGQVPLHKAQVYVAGTVDLCCQGGGCCRSGMWMKEILHHLGCKKPSE